VCDLLSTPNVVKRPDTFFDLLERAKRERSYSASVSHFIATPFPDPQFWKNSVHRDVSDCTWQASRMMPVFVSFQMIGTIPDRRKRRAGLRSPRGEFFYAY
jgi:hypothetical protein